MSNGYKDLRWSLKGSGSWIAEGHLLPDSLDELIASPMLNQAKTLEEKKTMLTETSAATRALRLENGAIAEQHEEPERGYGNTHCLECARRFTGLCICQNSLIKLCTLNLYAINYTWVKLNEAKQNERKQGIWPILWFSSFRNQSNLSKCLPVLKKLGNEKVYFPFFLPVSPCDFSNQGYSLSRLYLGIERSTGNRASEPWKKHRVSRAGHFLTWQRLPWWAHMQTCKWPLNTRLASVFPVCKLAGLKGDSFILQWNKTVL